MGRIDFLRRGVMAGPWSEAPGARGGGEAMVPARALLPSRKTRPGRLRILEWGAQRGLGWRSSGPLPSARRPVQLKSSAHIFWTRRRSRHSHLKGQKALGGIPDLGLPPAQVKSRRPLCHQEPQRGTCASSTGGAAA